MIVSAAVAAASAGRSHAEWEESYRLLVELSLATMSRNEEPPPVDVIFDRTTDGFLVKWVIWDPTNRNCDHDCASPERLATFFCRGAAAQRGLYLALQQELGWPAHRAARALLVQKSSRFRFDPSSLDLSLDREERLWIVPDALPQWSAADVARLARMLR